MKKVVVSILVVLAVLVAVPAAFLYYLNNGNPYEYYWVDREVPKHFEDMGFKNEDFVYARSVTAKQEINDDYYQTHYIVMFKDEPTIEYQYGVKKRGKDVVQFCEKSIMHAPNHYLDQTKDETLHSEDSCDTID